MPIESCLLEIAYDSILDVTLGHFDPQESVRLLSFGGDGLRLDLRLEPEGSGVTIAGLEHARQAPTRCHSNPSAPSRRCPCVPTERSRCTESSAVAFGCM